MSRGGVREDTHCRECAGYVYKPVTSIILFSWGLCFVAETVEGGGTK